MSHGGAYCSGCDTNWSRLPTMEGEEGDEWYEYCPCCRTDSFLEEGREAPTLSFNPITGEAVDDATGLPVQFIVHEPPPIPPYYERRRSIYKWIKNNK